jgi:hypothetical protein
MKETNCIKTLEEGVIDNINLESQCYPNSATVDFSCSIRLKADIHHIKDSNKSELN